MIEKKRLKFVFSVFAVGGTFASQQKGLTRFLGLCFQVEFACSVCVWLILSLNEYRLG